MPAFEPAYFGLCPAYPRRLPPTIRNLTSPSVFAPFAPWRETVPPGTRSQSPQLLFTPPPQSLAPPDPPPALPPYGILKSARRFMLFRTAPTRITVRTRSSSLWCLLRLGNSEDRASPPARTKPGWPPRNQWEEGGTGGNRFPKQRSLGCARPPIGPCRVNRRKAGSIQPLRPHPAASPRRAHGPP